jgi:hypothetical protein
MKKDTGEMGWTRIFLSGLYGEPLLHLSYLGVRRGSENYVGKEDGRAYALMFKLIRIPIS